MELLGPLPTSATLTCRGEVVDILDKGSGAVILADVDIFSESGERLAHCQINTFLRGAGGYGGHRNSALAMATVAVPSRPPDGSITEKIGVDQAALYRLNGDPNPLHIDPQFATMAGFPRPILHGLCTLGYATRHVLQQFCDNDVSKFKAIKARFTKPIYPGQTLQTDMWKTATRIHFTCKVVESGEICLAGGYVDLACSMSDDLQSTQKLSCELVFSDLKRRIATDKSLVKRANAVFLINVTKEGKIVTQQTIDLRQGQIYPGEPKQPLKAECTLTISDEDLGAIAASKLFLRKAFLEGRLDVQGEMVLVEKFSHIFQQPAKL
ncbi:hypothetical protein NP493_473g01021 [Ridgeia piscesae]|uniref:Peroxisomal multifunctional enzyme type 2 n=1 Tax=Ridgeia piscesae TaxID=27915 RepID=A0AAD9NUE3_RIDPI|nr:hypothetical protein NP493_473g01021 [Ridgeia piscesae]